MLSQLSYSYTLVRGGAQTHGPLVPKRISFAGMCLYGAPYGTRTHDSSIKSRVLYTYWANGAYRLSPSESTVCFRFIRFTPFLTFYIYYNKFFIKIQVMGYGPQSGTVLKTLFAERLFFLQQFRSLPQFSFTTLPDNGAVKRGSLTHCPLRHNIICLVDYFRLYQQHS